MVTSPGALDKPRTPTYFPRALVAGGVLGVRRHPVKGGVSLSQNELVLRPLEVVVEGDNVERAIKALKRKVATEGIYKELKRRRFYEKPSVKRKRKQREAERRRRKERRRALRARSRSKKR